MRGCLFTLLLGAVALVLLVFIGLPRVYAGVLTGALTAAGLHADDTTVHVESDPPTDLLGLHADTVTVTATDATFRGMQIGRLSLQLSDVAVIDRTADAVAGTLSDVTVSLADGSTVSLAQITVKGASDAIHAATVIDGAQAAALIADAVEQRTGVRPASVSLAAPDTLTVDVGVRVTGTLDVNAAGDLVVRLVDDPAGIGELVLLRGSRDLPITLTDARVTRSGDLRLSGDLSIGILG
ncbi:MAG TPA: hypothetical protein VFQ75_01850 [Candidatus Limnocylindrales bacterium]|nr:hypothetical protein [Candidatus Limnocylindrales bacterium]